jgi:plastocyanin
MPQRFGVLLLALVAACGRDHPPEDESAPEGAETVALTTPAPGGGALHIVRLVGRGDRYAFEPAEIQLRRGDVLRFVQTTHQPEAIAFDSAAAPADGAEILAERGLLRGPLLTEPGAFFDIPFAEVPSGEYPFFSIPHRDFGMRGRVIVE